MRKLKYLLPFVILSVNTSCKKEVKISPTVTPTESARPGKTPLSSFSQIAFLTGKSESEIPKDLDGIIYYATSSVFFEIINQFASVDFFTANFFSSEGSFQSIGDIVANDTIMSFLSSDTTYLKKSPSYYPQLNTQNVGFGFNKNTILEVFSSKETLTQLPIDVSTNSIKVPSLIERNKDITVQLQGNIVDGDSIFYYISDSANSNSRRYIFPVTQTTYTFTASQINAIVPIAEMNFNITIAVTRCRTILLSNGKKIMFIASNSILQPSRFNK